jgi:hypothetical protein
MTLAAGERRALAKIEKNLRGSDPKLVARLSTFTRLTQAEEMPQRESLTAPGRLRRLSAGPGFWSGRKRRTQPGQPGQPGQAGQAGQPGSSRRTGSQPTRGRDPRPGRDYRPGRDARLGRGRKSRGDPRPDRDLSPAAHPSPSPGNQSSTSRLPSQGRYPHTMRLSGPGRRHKRSRVAAILSVAMAACALGLMVVLFSVLNHVRPAGASPVPATTCHYVMMTGCQSAQITAHKR